MVIAQDQRYIERYEVELRAIETRLYIVLSILKNLEKTAHTKHPSTGTTGHQSGTTTSPVTTKAHASTTLSPAQFKDALIKRATLLENKVKVELAKLQKDGRTAGAAALKTLDAEVIAVTAKLPKFSDPDILNIFESEFYWLETRLAIDLQALAAQDKRVERLLAIATALKLRITSIMKTLKNTPVGTALEHELKSLDSLSASLKNAKDDKTVDNFELQLALIEKRVNSEIKPIESSTTKKF